jgi:hypothetical protein
MVAFPGLGDAESIVVSAESIPGDVAPFGHGYLPRLLPPQAERAARSA